MAMIMVLCLFINSIVEFRLRKALESTQETVISQIKTDSIAGFKMGLFPFLVGKGILCCGRR